MEFNLENLAVTASIWVLPILIAVTFHEAAHGWVAWRLGDPTAKQLGRVTFNPFKHIDLFGTVLLPAMMLLLSGGRAMFGFAKPVPVDFMRLRSPRRDMILVAAAGPGANILLAVAAALALKLIISLPASSMSYEVSSWLQLNMINAIWINMLLAVFNMLPIPPLDGGRVAVGMLPPRLAYPLARLERAGIFIVLGLIFLLPLAGAQLGLNLNIFQWLVGGPASFLMENLLHGVGVRVS